MVKVFLGGTCNGSTWRNQLIPMLKIDYFNPVVEDWTEEHMIEERLQREACDYCLYVITPAMKGVFSVAEAVEDSVKRPQKTIFCTLSVDTRFNAETQTYQILNFDKEQLYSLRQVSEMIQRNGGQVFDSLSDIAVYLNKSKEERA